ncbi:unnamed protein product, partial [Ixodes hexagonus]
QTLPDQHHCYYLSGSPDLQGVLVSGVQFTHPTHVPQILVFLRQQLLFNSLIASCVRPASRQNAESSHMFEVSTTSISNISISFEHPLDESLATVDLNLNEITSVKCRIYTLNSDISICSDEYASKVMQRCLSIPVTMRAVIRKAQGQRMRMSNQTDSYYSALNSNGPSYLPHLPGYGGGAGGGTFGGGGPDFASGTPPPKVGGNKAAGDAEPYDDTEPYDVGGEQRGGTLGSLLGQGGGGAGFQQPGGGAGKQSAPPNMMLMNMLSDVPSAGSSPSPSQQASFPFLSQAKPRKQRKRKATSSDGRSPKRKAGVEDDGGGGTPTPADLEDSTSVSLTSFEGRQTPSGDGLHTLPGEPFLEADAGQKKASSLLNPAEPSSAEEFHQQRRPLQSPSESFRGFLGDGGSLGDAGNDGKSARLLAAPLQCRKIKRVKSEEGRGEELKLEREGSRSQDSGPKNLLPGGDTERLLASSLGGGVAASAVGKSHSVSPPVIATSFKIEKSGDGLKISKAEGRQASSKSRDPDGRRKGDNRKERKRKRAESVDLSSSSHEAKLAFDTSSLDSVLQATLLPLESGDGALHAFNLTMKPQGSVSPALGQTPRAAGKKSSSQSSLPSGGNGKSDRPSKPALSSGPKANEADGRFSAAASGKLPKHKPSTGPPKSVAGTPAGPVCYAPSQQSPSGPSTSPSKLSSKSSTAPPGSTLKLKHLNLPSSTTITPVAPKVQAAPLQSSSAAPSITIVPTSGASSNNLNKPPKLRKGSLSAVIAKLTNTATPPFPPADPRPEGGVKSSEKRDSPTLGKEPKDKEALLKNSEGKMKYSSSDQFTVKQSSGIKLTVTKTSGTYKSSSSKAKMGMSSSKSSTGVSSSSKAKGTGSLGSASRLPGTSGGLAKKLSSLSSSSLSGLGKAPSKPSQKSPSPNTTNPGILQNPSNPSSAPRVSSSNNNNNNNNNGSGGNFSKGPNLAKQNAVPGKSPSGNRSVEKKTEGRCPTPTTEKVSSTLEANLMPPPPQSRTPTSGSTPKRPDEFPGVEENDPDRALRLLLSQPNATESTFPLEQWQPLSLKSQRTPPSADSSIRPDFEDKAPWVSSSTDIKPNNSIAAVTAKVSLENGPDSVLTPTDLSSSSPRFELISSTLEESANTTTPSFKALPLLLSATAPAVSKPPAKTKPASDEDSSPEDGLVIDFPESMESKKGSSSLSSSRAQSPKDNSGGGSQEGGTSLKAAVSPGPALSAKSPYFAAQSPSLKSPQVGSPPSNHSVSSSISRPSPCVIDDDLMDEAIMGLGK